MEDNQQFAVTYKMTRWDYAAMSRAINRKPWSRGVIMIAVWLLVVWGLLAAMIHVYNPVYMARAIFAVSAENWPLAVLFIVAILCSFFPHWIGWALSFAYYKSIASADLTATLTMNDKGVDVTSSLGDSTLPWTSIKRVIVERDYMFLPISKRESFIMPRRAFSSDNEFNAACQFAREKV